MEVNYQTPLAMLTVGQLDEFLSERFKKISPAGAPTPKRYVYGLEGICSIFGCRLNKAQELKKGIIKDAVTQHGRKIMVDVDKAIALYKEAEDNK